MIKFSFIKHTEFPIEKKSRAEKKLEKERSTRPISWFLHQWFVLLEEWKDWSEEYPSWIDDFIFVFLLCLFRPMYLMTKFSVSTSSIIGKNFLFHVSDNYRSRLRLFAFLPNLISTSSTRLPESNYFQFRPTVAILEEESRRRTENEEIASAGRPISLIATIMGFRMAVSRLPVSMAFHKSFFTWTILQKC